MSERIPPAENAPLSRTAAGQYGAGDAPSTPLEIYDREILDFADHGVVVLDDQFSIRYCNHQAEAIFACVCENITGQPVEQLLGTRASPGLRSDLRQLAEAHPTTLHRARLTGRHNSGRQFPVDVTIVPSERGSRHYILAVRDVAVDDTGRLVERDQRLLAEALRDCAAALTSTLDLGEVLDRILDYVGRVVPHDTSSVFLIEDGAVRTVRHRGYSRFDAVEAIEGFELPIARADNLRTMYKTRRPYIVKSIPESEQWVKLPGLEWISSYVGAPIILQNEVIGFLNLDSTTPNFFRESHAELLSTFAYEAGIAIRNARLYEDLSRTNAILEQKVLERTHELARAKESTERVLNALDEAVIVVNARQRIRQVNPAGEQVTGYAGDELVEQPWDVFLAEPMDDALRAEIGRALVENGTWRGEMPLRRKDGRLMDTEMSITRLLDEQGQPSMFVCSVLDISERKAVERIKDALISTVSHELRTPLATVVLQLSTLLKYYERFPDEERRQMLHDTQGQALVLRDLIDDILALSRFDAQQDRPAREWFDLAAECRAVLNAMRPIADERRISFTLDGLDTRKMLFGDPDQLARVVRNLVSNAIKYTPEGGHVTVNLAHTGHEVWLSIEDTGIGISSHDQTHLFSRFFRTEDAAAMAPGTGLGLPISQQIVEMHEGTIEVKSELGRGSRFTVKLPVRAETTY